MKLAAVDGGRRSKAVSEMGRSWWELKIERPERDEERSLGGEEVRRIKNVVCVMECDCGAKD